MFLRLAKSLNAPYKQLIPPNKSFAQDRSTNFIAGLLCVENALEYIEPLASNAHTIGKYCQQWVMRNPYMRQITCRGFNAVLTPSYLMIGS